MELLKFFVSCDGDWVKKKIFIFLVVENSLISQISISNIYAVISSVLPFKYSSSYLWTRCSVEMIVRIFASSVFSAFWVCSRILRWEASSALAYFLRYSSSILFVSIFCIRFSLSSWILDWFSAFYFWNSRDSAAFSCWSLLISIFKFFYFSRYRCILSWLSS